MAYSYLLNYFLSWQMVILYFEIHELDIGHTISDHLELKTSCVCPGDTVTFAECTTVGRGFTIWSGTAFNCTNDDIVLRHSTFNISAEECNKGAIIGRGLMVADNQYTSQLNITISSDIIGKTIQCYHESFDTQNTTEVGTLTISKPGPLPSPTVLFVSQADFMLRQVVFNWSEVVTDCSIDYNILASNCGSCPTTTNHTTVTCTNVPTDGTTCKFAVKSVSCGDTDQSFNLDDIYYLKLKLPFTPDNTSRDSLPILVAGIVLLVATVTFVIGAILVLLYRKRLSAFRSNFKHQSRTHNNMNQGEDICTTQNTIKIFDNEKMGNYGLDDSITLQNEDPVTTNDKDHPPNLNSLLHMLKGQAISSKWYHFGIALGVPKKILDQLTDYSKEDSLVEVLDYWLTHHPQQPTWKEISDAQNKILPPYA